VRGLLEDHNMDSLQECVDEYRRQLEKGVIRKAYRGLMEYVMDLRAHFGRKYPDRLAPGSIYHGYMDMTYFPMSPKSLKSKKLKIAMVFVHETTNFEVWLSGYNKQVQMKYWKLFKEADWDRYRIPSTTRGVDSVVEHTLVETPDFGDLDGLTRQIETGTISFIDDIEDFLSDKPGLESFAAACVRVKRLDA
jgi:hypothetical protein